MGRKLKCTVEEKVAAVEDYLNGTRSVSEIMADLSIKSTRTIRDWILAYQNGGIEALCQAHAPNEITYKDDLVRCAAMYVAAANLYDGSKKTDDISQFRAGKTNNDIK